jgi:hypothetical protein
MILMQKQTMQCAFKPDNGGPADLYNGRIDELALQLARSRLAI